MARLYDEIAEATAHKHVHPFKVKLPLAVTVPS
jgi:hypothetical protein